MTPTLLRAARRPALVALLALSVATPRAAAQDMSVVPVEDVVAAHLGFLASDALGGRETGTLQGDITAQYVAAAFRAAGLEPAGDPGSFLHAYDLETSQLDRHGTALVLSGAAGDHGFVLGEDFAVRVGGSTAHGEGGVVFAGYGLVDADQGLDDYAGLDVEGKVVLALMGAPEGKREPRSSGARRSWARERGAVALLMLMERDDRRSQSWFAYMQHDMERLSMRLPSDPEPGFAYAMLQPDAADRIAAAGQLDLDAARVAARAGESVGRTLDGVGLRLHVPVAVDRLVAHNVAGLLPGRDPELAHEVIVLSAHMDHVGINADGQVNNGADDNASGTTALMTAAALLAKNPAPRRSVLFLAVSAEEKGLLGSESWVATPSLDLARVVANVNIDMVGRNDPAVLGATPSAEHDEYNTLVPLAVALAPQAGLRIEWETGEGRLRRRVDEYYHRSDHANFSKAGIPVVFFFSGEHEDYHRPSDTLDKLDQGKVANVSRFVARLLTVVGDADERPQRLAP